MLSYGYLVHRVDPVERCVTLWDVSREEGDAVVESGRALSG